MLICPYNPPYNPINKHNNISDSNINKLIKRYDNIPAYLITHDNSDDFVMNVRLGY